MSIEQKTQNLVRKIVNDPNFSNMTLKFKRLKYDLRLDQAFNGNLSNFNNPRKKVDDFQNQNLRKKREKIDDELKNSLAEYFSLNPDEIENIIDFAERKDFFKLEYESVPDKPNPGPNYMPPIHGTRVLKIILLKNGIERGHEPWIKHVYKLYETWFIIGAFFVGLFGLCFSVYNALSPNERMYQILERRNILLQEQNLILQKIHSNKNTGNP